MDVGIIGISYYLPSRVETNEDLARENPDWRIEEIYAKSGIASRHVAADAETAADLGFQAARQLFSRSLVPIDEIDYLIFCTQSPDHFLPSAACILQQRLGLGRHVGAFDYNLACSGYIYGLQMAKAFISTGHARHVLLITADTYSKMIHPRDRIVRTLFGDGAAATLVGPVRSGRIGEFVLGTDGSGAANLTVPSGGFRLPRSPETAHDSTDASGCTRSKDNLFMDGSAVFAFAITVVPKVVRQLLAKVGIAVQDVDWFVYHQANRYMLDQLAIRGSVPVNKMVYDMEHGGNMVSASIPIAIQRSVEAGKISPGDRLVLVGFGVGYSWGCCDLLWE